jgi:secreted PhoX family phosphatase
VHDDVYAGSANMNAGNLFNSPDGMMIDTTGLIWIQTDGNDGNEGDFAGMGNNQMLAGDPVTGEIRRFLTGPKGCEVTGLTWSSDRRTMFVGIQHPGDDGGTGRITTARCAVGRHRGHAGRRRPRRLTQRDFPTSREGRTAALGRAHVMLRASVRPPPVPPIPGGALCLVARIPWRPERTI